MNRLYRIIGSGPITTSALARLFPGVMSPRRQIERLERQGFIVRLKRGLYAANPEFTGKPFVPELIANHLFRPSYLSMLTALNFYGLTEQRPSAYQSMTTNLSRRLDTPAGRFDYRHISPEAFAVGLRCMQHENRSYMIASPEKALCDLIAQTPKVDLRYVTDVKIYLEQGVGIRPEALRNFDEELLEAYIAIGKKPDSISALLKFLRR